VTLKELEEQRARVFVKFCCKLGKTFTEVFQLLNQAYGEDCMSRTQCCEWFKRFKESRMSVGEEHRPGRTSTLTNDDHVERVHAVIRGNRRLTVREVADEVGTSIGSCHQMFTGKLQMRRVSAKFLPHLLTDDQKNNRVEISHELLANANGNENFLKIIITGNGMWVYGYDVETKMQSLQWMGKESPRPKKARMSLSKIKVMLVAFFDGKGIVHHEFVPRGQMVNKQLYLDIFARLMDAVLRKRNELWENQTWMLHHDNAPAHTSLLIRSYLAKHQTSVVPHPPYSPDLAPADFFLFHKLKTSVKGRRFQTIEEI